MRTPMHPPSCVSTPLTLTLPTSARPQVIAREGHDIDFLSLSYTRSSADVKEARRWVSTNTNFESFIQVLKAAITAVRT